MSFDHQRLSPAHLCLAALALMTLAGSRLFQESGLLGHGAEIYGHAWRQWWLSESLPQWATGPGTLLWNPEALPSIDPVPTLFAATIGAVAGVEAGYNSWILASIGLAFAGGAMLAHRLHGDPWTGGVVLALSPPLLGSLSSGLTEDGGVGMVAIAIALIGHRDWRKGALGGILLGLSALFGLVLAWAGGLLAILWGISILVRDRARWKSLALGALCSLLLAWVAASLQGASLSREARGPISVNPRPPDIWPLNPRYGVDLASFFRPGQLELGGTMDRVHPAWMGAIALSLSVCAVWRFRAHALPLVLGLFVMLMWAPGDHLYWQGSPLGSQNPFTSVMDRLPYGESFNHHGRLLIIASLTLAGLASMGARVLGRRAPWAAAAIALEMFLLSPVSPVLSVSAAEPPDVLGQLDGLAEGPLLMIPVAGPGINPQRAFLDQRAHGRTLVADFQSPGLPSDLKKWERSTETGRWLMGLSACQEAPSKSDPRCTNPNVFEAPPGVSLLFTPSAHRATLESVLGVPDRTGQDGAVWELTQ